MTAPPPGGTLALLRLANIALRHVRLIVGLGLLVGGIIAAYTFSKPRSYSAAASFLVQAPRMAGNVPGIAAQLGFSLPTSDPGQSPAFYAEMVRSRGIVSALVDSTFTYRDINQQTVTATLADAYRVRRRTPALQRQATLERVQRAISVSTSQRSGVVTFAVASPAPALSAGIAFALLGELSQFNLQRRQSQAAAERKFTEQRLVEVGADLRAAEGKLEDFLRGNRSTANSPQLRFQESRLTREVDLRRSLYSSMAQSYEQAKIEEVRDTPQMTVVQRPEVPVLPNGRRLIGKTLAAGVFGALIGLLIGYSRERFGAARRESIDDAADFERLWAGLVDLIRHPFRSRRKGVERTS